MIRLEKRKMAKVLLAVPLALVHSAYAWIGEASETPISDMVMDQIFGQIGLESSGTVILTVENLCFSILFNLIMAGHIAECFRYSCVYVFTRIKNRARWAVEREVELLIYALLYQALYMITTACIVGRLSLLPLSQEDLKIFLTIYVYCVFILLSTTLAVNFLAMRMGVISAFFIVQGIMLGLFMTALVTRTNIFLTAINPVSCVGLLNYDFRIKAGIFGTNVILLLILFFVGMRIVQRYDVALVDPELN